MVISFKLNTSSVSKNAWHALQAVKKGIELGKNSHETLYNVTVHPFFVILLISVEFLSPLLR